MSTAPSIKILVCYHKPAHVFQNSILQPIHLGRALASKAGPLPSILGDMPGDDTGDNISELNTKFCEMTALYWAWRNYSALGNPEYFGLFHYRRLLDFAEANAMGVRYLNKASEVPAQSIDPQNIANMVASYDICAKSPIGIYIRNPAGEQLCYSVAKQYAIAHNDGYLPKSFELAAEMYPDYAPYAEAYLNSTNHYICNMNVMRKDIFFDYAKWLFSILFRMENLIDYKKPGQDIRAISYLSERLTGLYLTRLQKLRLAKIKHLRSLNIDCW